MAIVESILLILKPPEIFPAHVALKLYNPAGSLSAETFPLPLITTTE